MWNLGYGQQVGNVTNTRNTTQGFVIDPELTDPDGKWILTDAEMLSGHSGGPVINQKGAVIVWCVKSYLNPIKSWVRPINDAKQMLMGAGAI